MLTDQISFSLAEFFDQIGPSHDVITTLVARAGLTSFDPAASSNEIVGKKRRLRAILTQARVVDPARGAALVRGLLEALRSSGSFHTDSADFPGEAHLRSLREAFRAEGYILDGDGQLLPLTLDALSGAKLTDALEAYVRRALRGGDDDPLLVGTGKDLTEAVARHVLFETTGAYPTNANFEATMWLAYDRLGLAQPPRAMIQGLDQDATNAVHQALLLLAVAQNRLRNEVGSGHGRPQLARLPTRLARLAAQSSGLVSRMLLDRLSEIRGPRAA
jgi:hypothetical protein